MEFDISKLPVFVNLILLSSCQFNEMILDKSSAPAYSAIKGYAQKQFHVCDRPAFSSDWIDGILAEPFAEQTHKCPADKSAADASK